MEWKYLLAICTALVMLTGCRPSVASADAHDRSKPAFERAVALEQVGRLDDAIEQYQKLLLDMPRNYAAHLGLALLLHDYRQDYIGAIYHYKRYMAERGGGEKDATVTQRVRLAEQLLAIKFGRQGSDSDGSVQKQMTMEIDNLNKRITALEGEKAAAVAERDKLTRELNAAQAETQRLRRLVDNLKMADTDTASGRGKGSVLTRILPRRDSEGTATEAASSTLPPLGSEAIAAARAEVERLTGTEGESRVTAGATKAADGREGAGATAARKFNTYVVQPGDTLFRIAERHYGDGAQWTRIREANKKRIGLDGAVRAGQVLVIP